MIIHKYNKLNTYQGSHFYGGLLERKKKKKKKNYLQSNTPEASGKKYSGTRIASPLRIFSKGLFK